MSAPSKKSNLYGRHLGQGTSPFLTFFVPVRINQILLYLRKIRVFRNKLCKNFKLKLKLTGVYQSSVAILILFIIKQSNCFIDLFKKKEMDPAFWI